MRNWPGRWSGIRSWPCGLFRTVPIHRSHRNHRGSGATCDSLRLRGATSPSAPRALRVGGASRRLLHLASGNTWLRKPEVADRDSGLLIGPARDLSRNYSSLRRRQVGNSTYGENLGFRAARIELSRLAAGRPGAVGVERSTKRVGPMGQSQVRLFRASPDNERNPPSLSIG